MMTILHGDNRFYNNIFVQGHPITNEEPKESPFYQQVGTHVWDEYPTYKEWIAKFDMEEEKPDMGKLEPAHFSHLPVWADGNVYLAGAKAWKKEKHNLVKDDADVQIKLLKRMDSTGYPPICTIIWTDLPQELSTVMSWARHLNRNSGLRNGMDPILYSKVIIWAIIVAFLRFRDLLQM